MIKKVKLFLHNHRLLTCSVILFAFLFYLSYSINKENQVNFIESNLKNYLASIKQVLVPKVDVNYQSVINTFSKEKEEELSNLKELLELNHTSSFELINTSVIARDVTFYFSNLTVDKGKSSGIDKGMLAINQEGLVGVVDSVTKNSANISLLSKEIAKYKISVKVINGENIYNGIITGYDNETNEIIVESIRSQSVIEVGNIVYTNGLGDVYPPDITVGTVTKIEMDSVGINKILRLSTNVDFRNIKYLSIIKGRKS